MSELTEDEQRRVDRLLAVVPEVADEVDELSDQEVADRLGKTWWDTNAHPQVQRKIRRQREVLQQIRMGKTIVEAVEVAGVSKRAYQMWRSRDPGFKQQVDDLRRAMLTRDLAAEGAADAEGGYDGSFEAFRRIYMGLDTFQHQQELVDILDNASPMSVTLVTFPPEHGKTTTLEDFICWKLGEDPDFRFGLVSEKDNHGRKMIGRVQKRMTDPQFSAYQGRFGPFDPSEQGLDLPWRSDYFTVAGRTTDERDYSVIATGWSTAVSGSRYDRLLVDDVQSVKSLNLTDSIAHSLRQDHFTRVGRDGAIVIVATRVGDGDVYEKLLDEGVIDNHIRFPAVRPVGEPTCPDCEGRGVWGDVELDPDMPDAVKERGGWTCNCRALCPQMWDGRSLDRVPGDRR